MESAHRDKKSKPELTREVLARKVRRAWYDPDQCHPQRVGSRQDRAWVGVSIESQPRSEYEIFASNLKTRLMRALRGATTNFVHKKCQIGGVAL